MTATSPRPIAIQAPATRAVDAAGRVWSHRNPAELYRWVSRRNELLRTISHAPRGTVARSW